MSRLLHSRPAVAVLVSLWFAGLSACTRGAAPPEIDLSAQFRPGQRLFQFEYKKVTRLLLQKNDRLTPDRWTVRLERAPGSHPDDAEWIITQAPAGVTLTDNLADGAFVEHLLDTLQALRISSDPRLRGPLERFGLDAPLFDLEWGTNAWSSRLQIGTPVRDTATSMYARVAPPQLLAATPPEPGTGTAAVAGSVAQPSPVFPVQGATLAMLARVQRFDSLRRSRLLTLSADDIDEIEYWKSSQIRLYAERQYPRWVDRKGRRLARPIEPKLDAWTHLRIARFIDDPSESARLYAEVDRLPLYKIHFKERTGNDMLLRVRVVSGRVLATVSRRPGAVFELHHAALKHLAY